MIFAALLFLSRNEIQAVMQPEPTSGTLTIQTASEPLLYHIEIARTVEEKNKGLMFRGAMDSDNGMIFFFPDEQPRKFWMRNTLIPLDMVFISSDMEVVDIIQLAQPHDENIRSSTEPAKYVLEINGGQAIEHDIKIGQKIIFNDFE